RCFCVAGPGSPRRVFGPTGGVSVGVSWGFQGGGPPLSVFWFFFLVVAGLRGGGPRAANSYVSRQPVVETPRPSQELIARGVPYLRDIHLGFASSRAGNVKKSDVKRPKNCRGDASLQCR